MSVPTNLIPTKITGLPEYTGGSQAGFFPYVLDGTTYKVQFSNVASVGEVPPSRTLTAGTGLVGGGDLSANRVFAIANGGVGASQLDTTGVVAGVYGNGSNVPTVTVDANGRVTSVTTSPVVATGYVPEGRLIIAGTGLIGGGSLANNVTLSVNLASATPQALGTATAGVSTAAAREDHVHPAVDLSDTNETQGALPLGRGGTGDALSPVAGAVVYSTGTKFALTNPGISGQVLTSTGTDEPVWTTLTGTGTVTSVNASGGTTGMTFTGGPITTVGTLTLGGTLLPDNGGTGLTATPTNGQLPIGNGTGYALSTLTAGTAVSITNGVGSITIDNTAPDRIVSLTGAGTTSISGTYPNFTITSNDQFDGTVTSVAASGGSTGLTFSGSPITSAGTLTLGGTLSATSGGTGLSAAPANGQLAIGNGTGYSLSTITAGSGVSVTNAAGSITIANTAPDQIVSLTAGTAISVTGTYPSFTVTNTAPDQIVSLTGAGTTSISGTYPNFTITSNDQFIGTVTSVAASGGATGLTFSGSPITSAGTLTLSGTLAVASGGTGATNAGAARTALGAAASGANTDITSIALTSGTILNSPTSGTDIVNKAYADSIASGINFHQAVRLATVAALPAYTYNNGTGGVGATITANANGALSLDGVAVVAGNRVLIKNEVGAAQANQGVYVVTQTGSGSTPFILTRATDFDSAGSGVDQIDAGDFFLVTAGNTLANTSWVQQTPLPITIGTTPIIFSQFGAPVLYSAGTGLSLAGTVFSITNTGVSANTYGSASSVPVIAVNAQGQITSASSTSISIAASQITSGAVAVGTGGTGLTATPTNGQLLIGNGTGYSLSTLTAGTGVSVTNGSGSVTVTNTAPDQIVSLTGAGSTVVTGTYPNFTITSTAGTGTVTSVAASGGTTGLTFSGSPITTSGTLTLGGTLAVANGGTGATSLSSGFLLRGNGTSPVSSSVIFDNGTNVGIGTTSPGARLDVAGTSFFASDMFTYQNGGIFFSGNGSYNVGLYSRTADLVFQTNSAERMRLDSAGNLGLGVTLSAWTEPAFQLRNGAMIATAGPYAHYMANAYYQGGWKYTTTERATRYEQFLGQHAWFVAPSGTAGNAITFTQAMSLSASAELVLDSGTGGGRLTFAPGSASNNLLSTTTGFAAYNPIRVIASDIRFETGSSPTERLTINSSGNVTANVDVRAPIYYDSNNTAFYLDPAGTSVLTTIYARKSAANNTPAIEVRGGNFGFPRIQTYGLDADPAAWMGLGTDMGGGPYEHSVYFPTASGAGRLSIGDYNGTTYNPRVWVYPTFTQINNSTRSPIFFDSDNTSYYLDPASGSVLFDLNISGSGNKYLQINSTSGNEAMVRYIGATGSSWYVGKRTSAQLVGTADFHFFAENPGATVAGIDTAGNIFASGSVRAPIFYDSNNTGYYLDPASTSFLNTLSARETVGSGSATAFVYIAPDLFYYWTRVANLTGGDASATLLVTSKGDVNYVNSVSALLTVSCWNNSTASVKLETIGCCDTTMNVRIDNNNDVWIQVHSPWSSNLSWRLINKVGSPTVYYASPTQQTATPANSTQISYGQTARGTQGAMSSAAVSNVASSILGGLNALTEVRSPIYYDLNNTAFYLDPTGQSAVTDMFARGQIRATGWWGDPSPSVTGLGVEIGESGGRSFVLSYSRDAAAYGPMSFEATDFLFTGISGGFVRSDTSVRAPIFFDSNNTAFYLDPASTSITNIVRANTIQFSNGNVANDLANATYNILCDPSARIALYLGNGDPNNYYDNTGHIFRNRSAVTMAQINGSGVFAPVYYDSNDSAYYLDPNTTSNDALRIRGGATFGPNPNWGAFLRVGSNGWVGDYASVAVTNGNLHIDAQPGYDLYLNWYVARPVWSEGGAYFPIYYDRNNSGFYVDPASGSRLGGQVLFNGGTNIANNGDIRARRDSGTAGVVYFGSGDNYLYYDGGAFYLNGGPVVAGTDMRAPIFYDSNNTGFYLDPASTSYLNTVSLGAQTWRADVTWNSGVNVNVPASAECSFDVNSGGTWQVWDLTSSAPFIKCTAGTNVEIGQAGSRGLYVYGSITATGNVTAYSDIRVKDNVEQIEGALDRVSRIRGVTYTRTDLDDKERRYAGVIAQEIEQVLPEAVFESGDRKAVDYNATIGLLIEAIKELTARVAELEGK